MPVYAGSTKSDIYLGTQNTNCLTYIPENIKVRLDPIAWTQPTLTANGTMGGDSFACTQQTYYTETSGDKQEAWRMFAEGNAHEWQINSVSTSSKYWAKFYNPEVIKISKFEVVNPATGVVEHSPAKVVLYGSNDDSTYTEMGALGDITTTASQVFELPLTHTDWYKYYKIEVTPRNSTAVAVGRLKITAKSDDYVVVDKDTKTYVPNGSGVYDEIVTPYNLKSPSININSSDDCLLFVNSTRTSLRAAIITKCYCSDTNPAVTYSAWWDTTNNKIYRFGSDTVNPADQLSLPIAYLEFNAQRRITRIKPLKGVSFFGNKLIGLPSVKGLIPDGYNSDYTYKNKAFEWTKPSTFTVTDLGGSDNIGYIRIGINNAIGQSWVDYDVIENKNYLWRNGNKAYRDLIIGGTYTTNSDGNIIDININPVQPEYIARKIDFVYNGSTLIQHNFKPITFHTYPEPQAWTVPLGVSRIHVDCVASKGYGANGGNGGRVECDLSVTPGEVLYITVGYVPTQGNSYPEYNASDIRRGGTEYTNRILVSGGGGNQGNSGAAGGAGGGTTGGDGGKGYGDNSMGKGGTQTAGGAGGAGTPVSVGHYHDGNAGTLGLGGAGSYETSYEGPSGAGGAGYYGGGSGAGDYNKNGSYTAGGGGGSSFADTSKCTNVKHTQGYRKGAGYITITLA